MDVIEAIINRRSVRSYDSKPIPEDSYQQLLNALRFAPSACNIQPWHFILIKDPQLRQQVAQACRGQNWMAQAPLIVAACGLSSQAFQNMGGQYNSVDIDVAISLDHLSLAAVAQGLATCWIGAFNEQDVKQLLNVPDDQRIVALMPVGFPASADLNHPVNESKRKPASEIFSIDRSQ